jgi:hypothetical protein
MRVINERNYPQVLQEVVAVLRTVNLSLKRNNASASEIVALNLALKYLKAAIGANGKASKEAELRKKKSKIPQHVQKTQEFEEKRANVLNAQFKAEEVDIDEEGSSPIQSENR